MDSQLKTMIDNMPEKTGKSLEEWKKVLSKKTFEKHSEGVSFLKNDYGVTHGFANTIMHLMKEEGTNEEGLVEKQFQGKESLIPIYEKLISEAEKLGSDVKVVPKKTTVSLVRNKQFALIKPATKTRIDLGLKIKGKPTTGRLENSGPFGTMCTHRLKISEESEVDNELKGWLKEAYEDN